MRSSYHCGVRIGCRRRGEDANWLRLRIGCRRRGEDGVSPSHPVGNRALLQDTGFLQFVASRVGLQWCWWRSKRGGSSSGVGGALVEVSGDRAVRGWRRPGGARTTAAMQCGGLLVGSSGPPATLAPGALARLTVPRPCGHACWWSRAPRPTLAPALCGSLRHLSVWPGTDGRSRRLRFQNCAVVGGYRGGRCVAALAREENGQGGGSATGEEAASRDAARRQVDRRRQRGPTTVR